VTKQADISLLAGHRERLRQKFLDGKLADYELLELALGFAIPRRTVRPVARELMKKFGTVYQVLTSPLDQLAAVPGMGKNSAIFIKTMHSMMTVGFRGYFSNTPLFHDQAQLENYCRLNVGGKSVEEVHVLYLDSRMCLLEDQLHSVGTVNESGIYPREIVSRALMLGARGVALVHNHPTPGVSFSDEDKIITRRLMFLLAEINITLYDHFLVSGSIVYSARNMHFLD